MNVGALAEVEAPLLKKKSTFTDDIDETLDLKALEKLENEEKEKIIVKEQKIDEDKEDEFIMDHENFMNEGDLPDVNVQRVEPNTQKGKELLRGGAQSRGEAIAKPVATVPSLGLDSNFYGKLDNFAAQEAQKYISLKE